MNNETTQVSLTRKLRQLIGLSEIELSAEEADLYQVASADLFAPEFLADMKGELNDE